MRSHIPKAAKQQWVTMRVRMKPSAIAHVTGYSHRAVNRALRLHCLTGSVIQVPFIRGRPRLLNGIDLAVCALFPPENIPSY